MEMDIVNKLWVLPVITIIAVAGLFFVGQSLLPEEVNAADSNSSMKNASFDNLRYGSSHGSHGSGNINIFAILFYQQFLFVNSANTNVFATYIADCSDNIGIFNFIYNDNNNGTDVYSNDFNNSTNESDTNETLISESEAKSIAQSELSGHSGVHIGSLSLDGETWTVEVLDKDNKNAGSIVIDAVTGNVISSNINEPDDEDNSTDTENNMNDDTSDSDSNSDSYSSSWDDSSDSSSDDYDSDDSDDSYDDSYDDSDYDSDEDYW